MSKELILQLGDNWFKYTGTKQLYAHPMTRGEYNEYRGWTIPENEDPNELVYLVEYIDGGKPNDERHKGYITMSPKEVFDSAYRKNGSLTFGDAVAALKQGQKVARTNWNGKGMFVVYQKGYPQGIPCNKQTADAWQLSEGDLFKVEPYLQIRMVNGSHAMWVPSINDVLADDWLVL